MVIISGRWGLRVLCGLSAFVFAGGAMLDAQHCVESILSDGSRQPFHNGVGVAAWGRGWLWGTKILRGEAWMCPVMIRMGAHWTVHIFCSHFMCVYSHSW